MTVTVSRVHLLNVERGQPEAAELWDAITEQQLADWEGEWVPELFKALQRLRRTGVERRHWPQNRHWNWRKKTERIQGMLASPGFSIVCEGLTQGMMIVDTAMKRCRIDSQKGKHLVYVEADLFRDVANYCGSQDGGPLGEDELILTADNGAQHYFFFETFFNRYDALTLGKYVRPKAPVVAMSA